MNTTTAGIMSRPRSESSLSTASSVSTLDVPSDITLIEQVGRGTYGSVFSADYLGRRSAVKAVPIEAGPDGKALCKDLQREIKMLKTCDSEWVVRYFGCLQKNRTLWIAMELCDGSIADVRRHHRTLVSAPSPPSPARAPCAASGSACHPGAAH